MAKNTLDLSDFKLEKSVIEVRYNDSFLHWDRAGAIWTKLSKKWKVKAISANPEKTIFHIPNKHEFKVGIDRMHVVSANPDRSLQEFSDYSNEFISLVSDLLEIEDCTRIGFRLIYFKEYKSLNDAYEIIKAINIQKTPSDKMFGVQPKNVYSTYSLRWDGDRFGFRTQLRLVSRYTNIEVPFGIDFIEPIEKSFYGIEYDVDYYTVSPTQVNQINVKDWIKNKFHIIKRDSNYFLGGQ